MRVRPPAGELVLFPGPATGVWRICRLLPQSVYPTNWAVLAVVDAHRDFAGMGMIAHTRSELVTMLNQGDCVYLGPHFALYAHV